MKAAEKDQFTGRMFRRLWGPAAVSALGLSFADMADAVVVGQRMGATGLAAISLCLPIYMVINVGMHGLGLGGSVRYARQLGGGREKEAVENFNRILQAAFAVSAVLAVLGNLFLARVMTLLGAAEGDAQLYQASSAYARIIISGMPAFFLAYIINYYLRNDDSQRLAGVGYTVGNVMDIILSVLFVLVCDMGAAGAAFATVLGQLIAIVIYLPGILGKGTILCFKLCRPDMGEVVSCFRNGFSTSVQYIYQLIFLLIVNHVLIRIAGEDGVAVFDMLQNASYLIMYQYDGAAKAMQPLVSTYLGERNENGRRAAGRLGLLCGMGAGCLAIVVICLFPGFWCRIFGLGAAAVMGRRALRVYSMGAFFGGLSVMMESYEQSCEREKNAFVLATLRGAVILIPCAVFFSFWDIGTFWLLFPTAEILSLAVYLFWKRYRGEREADYDSSRVYSRTIQNKNEDLMVLTGETESFCQKWEASLKQTYFVTMAVEELCVAIMNRAFDGEQDGQGYIQLTLIALEDSTFELHLRDNAASFNPFSMNTKKASLEGDYNLDAMGILVIKQKAKTFFYRQYQGFNTLVVRV